MQNTKLKKGKYLIISDIHGNYEAFINVMNNVELDSVQGIIILGDIIDYGQRSNEVINELKKYQAKISINIWGNHEEAIILDKYDRFSADRGRECAKYTKQALNEDSKEYISGLNQNGYEQFYIDDLRCIAIHGSLNDIFWMSIGPENVNGDYSEFDYVLSGHSHLPHVFDKYYDSHNQLYRNKKKTTFINPGSVGQPRNHNKNAAYALVDFDSGTIQLLNCTYNIEKEQSFFADKIDTFYKERLERGI